MVILRFLVLMIFFSTSSFACDFNFDGVEARKSENAFAFSKTFVREDGSTYSIRRIAIPLNKETKDKLLNLANEKQSVCAYGSYSPSSPVHYYIYKAE